MDGFDTLGRTKLIMATNRPDTLDPALLRPGRLDRKIEIPLPNEQGRLEILKIHSKPVNKAPELDFDAVVKVRFFMSVLHFKIIREYGSCLMGSTVLISVMLSLKPACTPSGTTGRAFACFGIGSR